MKPRVSANIDRIGTYLGAAAFTILGLVIAIALLQTGTNPIASVTFNAGIFLAFLALIRPWHGLLIFLWVACFIDTIKRLAYIVPPFSFLDVAQMLIVPVLIMAGIYLRVFIFFWLGKEEHRISLRYQSFYLVLAAGLAAGTSVVVQGGLSAANLSRNYTFICYIPAAVAVPYVLNSPARWRTFSWHCGAIMLFAAIYGLSQSIQGPLPFEETYLRSGYTSTEWLLDQTYFRAFSIFNASSTYAGMICILSIYLMYPLLRRRRKFAFTPSIILLSVFVLFVSLMATQRGAFVFFTLTLIALKVLERPLLVYALLLSYLLFYALLIVYAEEAWDFVVDLNQTLQPYRTTDFLHQNTNLLTLGPRFEGFRELSKAEHWTPFGRGILGGNEGLATGHDLISNLLGWVGYIGLALFMSMMAFVISRGIALLQNLKKSPDLYLWAQINLACFLFILIWSLFLGTAFHVSPMNFFFWLSLGSLLYMSGQPPATVAPEAPKKSEPAAQPASLHERTLRSS
jgi:hypothetical protein